jgi:hypothetical protein
LLDGTASVAPGASSVGRAGIGETAVGRATGVSDCALSSSPATPMPPHTHSSRTSGTTTSAIAAGRPRYFCGAGPIAPSSRAIAGARYSTSATWPGWTGTTVSAVPIRDGSRYGTCMWTWC